MMVVDATTALIPALMQIWMSGLGTLYDAMHSVLIFGVPLDAVVALVIFMDCMVALYVWRLG